MKKTFIAPKAQTIAMQTEQLMQASGMTQGDPTVSGRPGLAQAKLSSEFQWN